MRPSPEPRAAHVRDVETPADSRTARCSLVTPCTERASPSLEGTSRAPRARALVERLRRIAVRRDPSLPQPSGRRRKRAVKCRRTGASRRLEAGTAWVVGHIRGSLGREHDLLLVTRDAGRPADELRALVGCRRPGVHCPHYGPYPRPSERPARGRWHTPAPAGNREGVISGSTRRRRGLRVAARAEDDAPLLRARGREGTCSTRKRR